MARAHYEGVDKPHEAKQCPRCKQWLPITQENFYARKRGETVFFESYCITCQKAYAKRRYEAQKEEPLRLLTPEQAAAMKPPGVQVADITLADLMDD